MRIKPSLPSLLANESGGAAAKYGLIAMLISIAVAAAITGVGSNLNNMLVSAGAQHQVHSGS